MPDETIFKWGILNSFSAITQRLAITEHSSYNEPVGLKHTTALYNLNQLFALCSVLLTQAESNREVLRDSQPFNCMSSNQTGNWLLGHPNWPAHLHIFTLTRILFASTVDTDTSRSCEGGVEFTDEMRLLNVLSLSGIVASSNEHADLRVSLGRR